MKYKLLSGKLSQYIKLKNIVSRPNVSTTGKESSNNCQLSQSMKWGKTAEIVFKMTYN